MGVLFCKFSLSSPKRDKIISDRTLLTVISQRIPFFVNSPFQSGKGVNLYWKNNHSFTLTSSNNQVLGNLFMFRESEKGLKENSKFHFFVSFNEFEKGIKMYSWLKNDQFSWKIQFLHKNLKHYTYLFKISKNAFKNTLFKVKNK